jgi:hypothetical protein
MKWIDELKHILIVMSALLIGSGASLDYLPYKIYVIVFGLDG